MTGRWAIALLLIPVSVLALNGCNENAMRDQQALIELGNYLFFDQRLSGDGSISCATCHDPNHGWADGSPLSQTYPASDGFRNSKSLLNVSSRSVFYWDGAYSGSDPSEPTEEMITGKLFLNMHDYLLTERLKQVPEYVSLFDRALGAEPSFDGVIKSLVAFQSTLTTGEAPQSVENSSAERGRELFSGKAQCSSCHTGVRMTDAVAHSTGVPENPAIFQNPLRHTAYRVYLKEHEVEDYMTIGEDVGRFAVTKNEGDRGAFITPDLRQVADTAPFMHNGVFSSLEDVVSFYNERGEGLSLTPSEVTDVVSFLGSLSGSLPEVADMPSPGYQVDAEWLEVNN